MKEEILDAPSSTTVQAGPLVEYPPMLTRVKAIVIDGVATLALMVLISSVLDSFGEVPTFAKIALFIGILLYDPVLTAFGATLGQLVFGIRVRDVKDTNKKINLGQSIIRYIVKASLGWISLIVMSFSGKRRAIHDMAGGSIMVYK